MATDDDGDTYKGREVKNFAEEDFFLKRDRDSNFFLSKDFPFFRKIQTLMNL
jgi:hypothetical protein